MACTSCNGNNGNANPLDCNTQFMQCNNPCGVTAANTPACESLPSQIQNFTDQFFGQVIKTEVNGEVVWSLPCSLDTGLPNNPRGVDEGLACYFLRLFRDGIGGLTGPKGDPGTPGTNGTNTYTVTVQSFGQPSLNSPLTQIVVVPNPSIVEGIGIFVQHSGFYTVTNVAPGGVLFVTMTSPLAGALAVIPSGSIVTPVGGIGPQGPQGIQGPQGVTTTGTNGTWSLYTTGALPGGTVPYALTGGWTLIDFGTDTVSAVVPTAGTYLVTGVVSVTGEPGIALADIIRVRLQTSEGTILHASTEWVNNLANGEYANIPVTAIAVISAAGASIQAYGTTDGAALSVIAEAQGTYLTWVRIA